MGIGFYVVQPGDEVFRILRSVYGDAKFLANRNEMVAYVIQNNPDIQDIDRIFPGQVIALPNDMAPGQITCGDAKPPAAMTTSEVANTLRLRGELSMLQPEQAAILEKFGEKALQNTTSSFVGNVKGIMDASQNDMSEVVRDYWSHKASVKTRGQYDYSRHSSIVRTQNRMGRLERLAMTDVRDLVKTRKTNTVRQLFRIDRSATARTHAMVKTVKDMRRISKVAKYGKGALFALGPAIAITEIAMADKAEDRVGIAVDCIGSYVGAAGAVALTVFVVGTPVGWFGIAAVAVVAAAGGMVAGATAEYAVEKAVYDSDKSWVDQLLD